MFLLRDDFVLLCLFICFSLLSVIVSALFMINFRFVFPIFFIGLFAISFQIHQSFNRKSTIHNSFCQYNVCVCAKQQQQQKNMKNKIGIKMVEI